MVEVRRTPLLGTKVLISEMFREPLLHRIFLGRRQGDGRLAQVDHRIVICNFLLFIDNPLVSTLELFFPPC